ncbi:replication factor C large subunit [Methanosarcinales archaeon]|nr:MAG: replication factor C large subunit [Methanosarcinales archaeon]
MDIMEAETYEPHWAEKYRPRTLNEVAGNKKTKELLLKWAREWDAGRPNKKAVLCYGKPGTGKTSAIIALANDMNWEIIELNASDKRTAEKIEKTVVPASTLSTLTGLRRRLILLDEADNLHGIEDRGGVGAIARAIKNTGQPIALTANDVYAVPMTIKNICLLAQFKALRVNEILKVLKRICEKEGIKADELALMKIAQSASGDLRGAINDLQALAEGRNVIREEDVVVADREHRKTIFEILSLVFKGSSLKEIMETYNTVDKTPEEVIHWIDENIPLCYKESSTLYEAYKMLSRADLFLGRVKKRQMYSMWKYAIVLMLGGVMSARTSDVKPPKFSPPSYLSAMGRTKTLRSVRDSLAKKAGRLFHVSSSYAKMEILPFLKMLTEDEEFAIRLRTELELTDSEFEYLVGDKASKLSSKSYSKSNNHEHQKEDKKEPNYKNTSVFEY